MQTVEQLSGLPPLPDADPNLALLRQLLEVSASVNQAVDGHDGGEFFRAVGSCCRYVLLRWLGNLVVRYLLVDRISLDPWSCRIFIYPSVVCLATAVVDNLFVWGP